MSRNVGTNNARSLRKAETEPEQVLWSWLRNHQLGFKFRRQQPIGKYIVDFACMEVRLIIEIDGGQHTDPPNVEHDRERTEWLESQGYTVLRFWNSEIANNLDGVLGKIKDVLRSLSPSS